MPLRKKIAHEIHPEIVDIPGRIQYDSNSHSALVTRISCHSLKLTDGWSRNQVIDKKSPF
jgi:hypothetical protein